MLEYAKLNLDDQFGSSLMDSQLEQLTFALNILVLIAILLMRNQINPKLSKPALLASFLFYLLASGATVLEHHFLPHFMNFIEHSSYAVSALCFLAWCHQILIMATEEEGL